MRTWRRIPSERRSLPGAIGLRLVDELTGLPPIGRVRPLLDLKDGTAWRPAEARVVVNPSGIVTCPGLEKRAFPAAAAPRRYRIRIEADLYRPLYRATDDGVEFDAHPWNDFTPPSAFAASAVDAALLPGAGYPFPGHVRVLYGQVVDAAGDPVADAMVIESPDDRTMTDERGAFALPLRTALENAPVQITADHPRMGLNGSVAVTLPADLGHSHTIQVS